MKKLKNPGSGFRDKMGDSGDIFSSRIFGNPDRIVTSLGKSTSILCVKLEIPGRGFTCFRDKIGNSGREFSVPELAGFRVVIGKIGQFKTWIHGFRDKTDDSGKIQFRN